MTLDDYLMTTYERLDAGHGRQVEKDEEQRTRQEGLSRLSTMMGKSTDLWRGMANMG